MTEFADIFASRPVLADGAMGTVLYARGIFINRCYDDLNLSDPGLILSIHEEYLQSGAEILETNTFGANRFRLARHGLAEKVAEINAAGVRLARQAVEHLKEKQAGEAWVAGSVGPLGVRLEPLGKTGLDEARAAFAEQIAALAAAGADLLIIETMPALNEAQQALIAAREMAPDLPVLVMVTVDDESNCLDGSSPEQAAAKLTEWGAGAIGVNCSTGPATVLTAIEAMRKATTLPLAAMPNAGMPRAVEGRNIYLCSPEYMASFARKAIAAGAQIVGGCCGTTPNHIRAMRSAMRAIDAQARVEVHGTAPALITETPPAPLGGRSRIGSLIEQGQFVTLVEIVPPKGIDCVKEIEGARLLAGLGVHAINVPDSPRASARMSAQSAIPKTADNREAVASAFSVIRNVSVPLGISTPGQPNISSTIWRTVSDHKNRRYYFESTRSPNIFWVDLADLNFAEGQPAKKLTLTGGEIYTGDAAAKFENAKPFAFLPASGK
jgi:homocysteine S-methyltransferase